MKENQIQVKILSEKGELYNGDCRGVLVPTENGETAILPYHTSMVAVLAGGEVKIISSDGNKVISEVDSGVVRVSQNKVVVLINL